MFFAIWIFVPWDLPNFLPGEQSFGHRAANMETIAEEGLTVDGKKLG
jgi:hypothetical protein